MSEDALPEMLDDRSAASIGGCRTVVTAVVHVRILHNGTRGVRGVHARHKQRFEVSREGLAACAHNWQVLRHARAPQRAWCSEASSRARE
jgi:hypothetical protein